MLQERHDNTRTYPFQKKQVFINKTTEVFVTIVFLIERKRRKLHRGVVLRKYLRGGAVIQASVIFVFSSFLFLSFSESEMTV